MNVNEALQTQEFFKKMRKEQVGFVIKTVAPTIGDYFEELKYQNDDDKYKQMILEFLEEIENAKNVEEISSILKRYQQIVNDYKRRIEKIERGDNDIGLVEGDIDKTKELIKPVDLICGFVDNLIYGEYTKEQIEQYITMWKEKSMINPLAPADIKKSPSGRHTNLAYEEKEQGELEI